MTNTPQKETLERRIKQRLQSRYLRWLARNKPDTFCYREPWRRFLRSARRISESFWRLFDMKFPDWLLFALGGPIAIVMAGGVVYIASVFAWIFFHTPPSEIEQLSIEDQACFGFFRLSVIQFAALLTFILTGITIRDSSEEKRDFKHVMPGDRRRAQVGMIQFFAGLIVTISWVAAFFVPLGLPSYTYAALATGLTGTILFWSSHWISRWLGLVEIPWEGKGGDGLVAGIGMILCLGAFLFAIVPENVEYVRRLTWMLPTGWLNEQAREIGEGNFAHAWLLVGGWGVVLAVGFMARGQTKTWWHRCRVLRRACADPSVSKPCRKRKEFPLSDIPADFRRRLRGIPTSWHAWLLPDWSRSALVLLVTVAAFCLLLQGVAYSVHLVISQLADPAEPIDRPNHVLFYAAITVMALTVEICGLLGQDRILRSSFERQPISPWGLWKRFQFNGLVRLPLTVMWTLPMLILPTIVHQGNPTVPLATLGLCLSAVFAIRTLMVAAIVQQGIYRELHELIGGAFVILAMGLGLGGWLLIMLAAVPDFPDGYPVMWRQLAAHGSTLLLFLAGTQIWHWSTRLALRKPPH